jgi:DNA-binding NtrC family response regulator
MAFANGAPASTSKASTPKETNGRPIGGGLDQGQFGRLVGVSPAMRKVYELITRIAPTEVSVLLLGETGTGKDLVAQTIHDLSARNRAPFLPVNCGAVSPTLFENELFGHERGSFTGAERVHKGYFERADHGTLLLDEITEMPVELQVKLLRVLETGTLVRIGGTDLIKVDVRVIAASNRTPHEAIAAGKLREDLLYRLNTFPIDLPPLRERKEDLELLCAHFLALLNESEGTNKRLAPGALGRLRAHDWSGNVRELKNVLQRAFILAEDEIGEDCLTIAPSSHGASARVVIDVGISIAEAERLLIEATLEACAGDKQKAAAILDIGLKTLYNRLNQYKRTPRVLGRRKAGSPFSNELAGGDGAPLKSGSGEEEATDVARSPGVPPSGSRNESPTRPLGK